MLENILKSHLFAKNFGQSLNLTLISLTSERACLWSQIQSKNHVPLKGDINSKSFDSFSEYFF